MMIRIMQTKMRWTHDESKDFMFVNQPNYRGQKREKVFAFWHGYWITDTNECRIIGVF